MNNATIKAESRSQHSKVLRGNFPADNKQQYELISSEAIQGAQGDK